MTVHPIRLLLSATALALAVTPALADNGKGKSHAKGAAAQSASAKSNHGALASELKGLNAAHASSNAMANADPESQVGRIALYRDAALLTIEKAALVDQLAEDLAGLPVPTRTVADIDAEIAGLDPLAEGYAEALALLEEEKQDVIDYDAAVLAAGLAQDDLEDAALAEGESLLTASNGRVLSDAALAYLRSLLSL
jgi:hypothetical protein